MSGEVEIDTANKSIGRISSMYRTINENRQLGLAAIFENLRIGGGRDKQRVAFASEFVQERILADGVFADLNAEARRVIEPDVIHLHEPLVPGPTLTSGSMSAVAWMCADGSITVWRLLVVWALAFAAAARPPEGHHR